MTHEDDYETRKKQFARHVMVAEGGMTDAEYDQIVVQVQYGRTWWPMSAIIQPAARNTEVANQP